MLYGWYAIRYKVSIAKKKKSVCPSNDWKLRFRWRSIVLVSLFSITVVDPADDLVLVELPGLDRIADARTL